MITRFIKQLELTASAIVSDSLLRSSVAAEWYRFVVEIQLLADVPGLSANGKVGLGIDMCHRFKNALVIELLQPGAKPDAAHSAPRQICHN